MAHVARALLMLAAVTAGYLWLRPAPPLAPRFSLRFIDEARAAGCLNQHSMPRLADDFANIMPWLSSVGAAAAAADFDNDGWVDLYVTNSGRGDSNRLFRNRGDGKFEDVTSRAGVGCGNPVGASMHAIWGDIDNDGDLDLYLAKWAAPNDLFLNNGDGTFTNIAARSGVDYWGYGNAATFLDFDRDGRLDILVGNYFAETIRDPASGRMVPNDLWRPVSTRVMHETFTHAANGGRTVLYRSLGPSEPGGPPRFENVAPAVGLNFTGWTLAVGAADFNNDGWPDLYLANDFGPDEFYLNTGATEDPPRFRLVIDPRGHPGVGNDWWKGMNVDAADVNNDGYLDVYVTNIMEKRYKTDEGNMLWLNCADAECPGGRGFRNVAERAGVQDGGWGWGAKFADLNNDGLLDIFTVNGFVTGDPNRTYWFAIQEMVTQTRNNSANAADWPVMGDKDLSGHERARLFVQVARETPSNAAAETARDPLFVDVAEQSGIADLYNGRGIAVADFNGDGALDLYVANQGAPSCVYVNHSFDRPGQTSPRPAYLRLRLVGRPDLPQTVGARRFASTADAVGARATLYTTRGFQVREVQGGIGFSSQSEHTLHFGVPDPDAVERLTVWWPSGRSQEILHDDVRRLLNRQSRLVEGETPQPDVHAGVSP